jgi:hypothetical protein
MSKTGKFKVDLMMDSGAFSAWTRKQHIDLKEYIEFVREYEPYLWQYINLDVIPGARDEVRTQSEVEASAQLSYRNQQTMKDAGLRPIPVFHQGEPFSWLERLLKDGETYIGVSPFKDIPFEQQSDWLDECFTALTNSDGAPFVRTHGFGTTQTALLLRYPFYTVDSTTWSLTPGMGQIIVPSLVNGEFNYLVGPQRVSMGERNLENTNKRKYDWIGPNQKEAVTKFLREEVGCTLVEARYGTRFRRKAVLIYFLRLGEHLYGHRFKYRKASLGKKIQVPKELKPRERQSFHVIFATNFSSDWSQGLNEVDARKRLVSFYEIRNRPERLIKYVKDGIVNRNYERKQPPANWGSAYENYRRLALVNKVERNNG